MIAVGGRGKELNAFAFSSSLELEQSDLVISKEGMVHRDREIDDAAVTRHWKVWGFGESEIETSFGIGN